jgi:type VI secretion system protein ImpF
MAEISQDQRLLPSVFDRLIDLEPERPTESPKSQSQIISELKTSLRRDLENLLNTRWSCTAWPPDYEELDFSLVNYGIPDFTGINMGGQKNRDRLIKIVKLAIEKFEPRLIRFTVKVKNKANDLDRMLSFRVDGLLRAEPYPEQVVFDASLDVQSSEFDVMPS